MEVSMVSASHMGLFLGRGPLFSLAFLQVVQRGEGASIFQLLPKLVSVVKYKMQSK